LGKGRIDKIAITQDGMTLIVVSSAGMYLYDVETLEETRLSLDAFIYDIAIDPSGNILAVATESSLQLWDLDTRQYLGDLDTLGPYFSVTFNADGSRLASGGEYVVRIWDVKSALLLQELNVENSKVLTVAFHPKGTLLVCGGYYRPKPEYGPTLQLWDLISERVVYNLDESRTHYQALFSPDGSLIASANSEEPRVWETSTGQLLQRLQPYPSRISYLPSDLAFSIDGKTIIGDGGLIQQWNLEGELINVMRGTNIASYNSEGQKIVSQVDTTFEIWDLNTGEIERVFNLPSHSGAIIDHAFSPDGRTLVTVAEDDMVRIWDVKSGQLEHFHLARYENLASVAFHPGGEILAYGGCSGVTQMRTVICYEGKITLWDVASKRVLRDLGNFTDINKIAFSPDGQILAANVWEGVSSVLLLYDLHSNRLQEIRRHCFDFVFNPDGSVIAVDCMNEIQLLDVNGGDVIREFLHDGYRHNLAFSPNGNVLASTRELAGTIKIWDISGNPDEIRPQELDIQGDQSGWIPSMAFSVDGDLLAVAVGGNAIQLWDVYAGKLLLAIDTPNVELSFSLDDLLIATGGDNGIIHLWGIRTE
jgi:WD40 repeat protein